MAMRAINRAGRSAPPRQRVRNPVDTALPWGYDPPKEEGMNCKRFLIASLVVYAAMQAMN